MSRSIHIAKRFPISTRRVSCGGGRGGDEGLARTRGGYVAETRRNRGKMKSAPGPVPSDFLMKRYYTKKGRDKKAAHGPAYFQPSWGRHMAFLQKLV